MITHKQQPDTKERIDSVLHPLVKEWFYNRFPSYSLTQLYGVYPIHCRNNILLSAPTGGTKTLTGFLAIINELVDSALKGLLENQVYAIYISPLKALNYDIQVNLEQPLREIEQILGRDLGIRIGVRTGDTTAAQRSAMSKQAPHILITTPESFALLLNSTTLSLTKTQWIIIDEIHALAENKRGTHLALSVERLNECCGGLTRIGLSATVAPLDAVARFLCGTNPCIVIRVPLSKSLDLQVLSPVNDLVNTTYQTIEEQTYILLDRLIQSHATTLVFTNTRAATERIVHQLKYRFPRRYYEMAEQPPHEIASLIGAHHGSLSKEHRVTIEQHLREGTLRCVVCSTSLELGIDIGHVDLVVLLSSPKSTARLLQRIGRAGHALGATTKGRIIVQDRDDLLECSVMLAEALSGHIDTVHIPNNALDVLAQHLVGMALDKTWSIDDAYKLVTRSYPYMTLSRDAFMRVLNYLSGTYQDQHVYAKIWMDSTHFGKRGRMTRVIYNTNIGTIADSGGIQVRVGSYMVGTIDEGFLEYLKPKDIFVLGGDTYQFIRVRGMVLEARYAAKRTPTVPSWYSQMLPLSYDVGQAINTFRTQVLDHLDSTDWVKKQLSVDDSAAQAIVGYCQAQHSFSAYPTVNQIVIEYHQHDAKHYAFVLAPWGRRVHDALSRCLAFAITRQQHMSCQISVSDYGILLVTNKHADVRKAFDALCNDDVIAVAHLAIEDTEILKRRFRHCARRALMILPNYRGRTKRVGQQQMSSTFLLHAVKRIDPNFIILQEARREVLEDAMDIVRVSHLIERIRDGLVTIITTQTAIPSPFAFHLFIRNYSDLLTAQDRQSFLRTMHQMVVASIALKKGTPPKEKISQEPIDYAHLWPETKPRVSPTIPDHERFGRIAKRLRLDPTITYELTHWLEHGNGTICQATRNWVDTLLQGTIPRVWPDSIIQKLSRLP